VANFQGDYDVGSVTDGRSGTLVITLTGTATPALADVGSSGTAAGKACLVYLQAAGPDLQGCTNGTASVAVGTQVTRATPPPTSTVATTASVGSTGIVWLLPMVLIGLSGGLMAFGIRRRRTS